MNKRLLPIEILEGKLDDEIISKDNIEIGKILIKGDNPFAVIKFKNDKFEFNKTLDCGFAKIKVIKPNWFNYT